MTNQEYLAYLKTDKWKGIAHKRMTIDNFTCQMCGTNGTPANVLQVHHMSYRYLGNEENRIYEDLVTVCGQCHKLIHRLMSRKTGVNRWGWGSRTDLPTIGIYTLSGTEINVQEVKKHERSN